MKLTENNYWNSFCKKSSRVNHINISLPPYQIIHQTLAEFLSTDKEKEFIEIGCGLGNWCVYFNKYFKYKIYGIDYTKEGVKSCSETLEKNKITPQEIYLEDFTTYEFNKKFDVVFSMGFVEHFTNYQKMIQKHIDITKKGGFTVIMVPNIKKNIYNEIQKLFNEEVLNGFIHIYPDELSRSISKKDKVLYSGYVGKINFGVVNTHNANYLIRIVYFISSLFIKVLFKYLLFWIPENKMLSPYILLIVKKL